MSGENPYREIKLRPEEAATLTLRAIYEKYGYRKYKMSRFEEYSLYADNKDFLGTEKVITFTDLDGRLMALKPDVTLSIIKNTNATEEKPEKFYYIENVYREDKTGRNFAEIQQMGLEYIGGIATDQLTEVVGLAAETLTTITEDSILELSHMDYATGLLGSIPMSRETYLHLLKLIRNKNRDGIIKVSKKAGIDGEVIAGLPELYGKPDKVLEEASKMVTGEKMERAVAELEEIWSRLKKTDIGQNVMIDFSAVNDIDYYNGIIFRGYIKGLPKSVLAGGQYSKAMEKFGKTAGAVGFALYLNEVARIHSKGEKLIFTIERKGESCK